MSSSVAPWIRTVAAAAAAVILLAGCGAAGATPGFTYAPASSPGASGAAGSAAASPTVAASIAPTPTPEPTLSFTPGTVAVPRIFEMTVDDLLNFTPGLVQAAVGETVTFRIQNMGKAVHEFMIGPLVDAFADKEGTPEVADIAPGKTAELTFTFTGKGPFAFACHAPGHYEHGMAGYVQLVGPGAPTIGTKDEPRVVHINMADTLKFTPDQVAVAPGETVRFVLTNSGKAVHEFQIGPAEKVAADEVDGVTVIEKDELDEGSTRAVDYTFTASGPFAFACHEPAHYEAGMKGTIQISGG
jgi:uncharacterized cupredoxin-like copper-binding protein